LLSEPSSYAVWWDTGFRFTMEPNGAAQRGQQITAASRALGLTWLVHITVNAVDAARRAIDLTTRLPFGITVHNHITVNLVDGTPPGGAASRVSFG
jgi:ligand-binding SRPBCC domain-containing protein